MAATRKKGAVAFIFITVVLDMLALGIIIPVLPKLVQNFLGGDTARAAEMFGIFGTVWAIMHFFSSPFLGALSDRFGRRPVILLSGLGLGLDYILMALAPTLGLLFVGRVISGMTAGSISAANAYIADVTPPEKRAQAFGFMGMAFGLGFVLGPAVGGLLGGMDPRLPFWVAAGMSFVNTLYGILILPESLPVEKRAAFQWSKANPVGSLQLLRSYPELLGLAFVTFLSFLAHVALPSTFVLYSAYRYGWVESQVGMMLAFVGVCSIVVQGALVGPIVARIGERKALVLGLLLGAAGFAAYGLAPSGAWFLVGTPLMALWGLTTPAAQGMMTRMVSESEQGRLQGANGSLMGIAELMGPLIFTYTFAFAIADGRAFKVPGAPFLLAAGFLGAGALAAWYVTRPKTTT